MLQANSASIHQTVTNLASTVFSSLSPSFLTHTRSVDRSCWERPMGEEARACDVYYDHVVICKGKRSKRQRVHVTPRSPEVMIIAAEVDAESSSSVADDVWRSGCADQEEAASGCVTEEEEDMALCLMLLARGGAGRGAQAGSGLSSSPVAVVPDTADSTVKGGKFRSRRPADGGAGEFVYECKTCGRCFASFQALGGHRTSHKKPRLLPPSDTTASDEKSQTPSPPSLAGKAISSDPTVLAIPAVPATPPKQEAAISTAIGATRGVSRRPQQQGTRVHECNFCGAEFGSGQALGGHMRRHRPLVPASASSEDVEAAGMIAVKEKSFLELDLNMPAPCEDATAEGDERTASFAFAVREKPAAAGLLFPAPASALVDCQL